MSEVKIIKEALEELRKMEEERKEEKDTERRYIESTARMGQTGRVFINELEGLFHQLDYRLWKIEFELKNRLRELEKRIESIERITQAMGERMLKIGEEKRRTCIYNEKGFCTAYVYEKTPSINIKYKKANGGYYYEANEFNCYFCMKYQSEEEQIKKQYK